MNDKDKEWVDKFHPELVWSDEKKCLEGELAFSMYYSPCKPNQYIINPKNINSSDNGEHIKDVYEILMCWQKSSEVPSIRETNGRILRAAEKWGVKNTADMHIYLDGTLCLFPPPEKKFLLSTNFTLQDFFTRAVIPFLYYQSYFEKYGREPWRGAAHGVLGLLESYCRITQNTAQSKDVAMLYLKHLESGVDSNSKKFLSFGQLKGHHLCLCGSGKKFRNCHKEALWGFNALKRDLE